MELVDLLHVVMPVEQYVWPRPVFSFAVSLTVAFGDDRGMACRRPDIGRKTERRDILRKMIGRRLAVARKRRIGRDRLDPQKRKQPLQAVVEIGIDTVEDRLKLRRVGHFGFSLWASGDCSAHSVVARPPP